MGVSALGSDTLGSSSTAIGHDALGAQNFTTATNSYNVAVGRSAGASVSTGQQNTLIGATAGDAITTGSYNTFVGMNAGGAATEGTFNALLGRSSGSAITTGGKNTIIGSYNGNQGSLDIRTSSNNIVLSDGDGNPRGYYHGGSTSPAWVFKTPTANQNSMFIDNTNAGSPFGVAIRFTDGDPNNSSNYFLNCQGNGVARFIVYSNGNAQNTNNSYGAISDVKLKENIIDASSQWDDIKALTVRKYSLKQDNLDSPNMLGVIAQEVEAAGMGGLVIESPDVDSENNDLGTVTKSVQYSVLYMKAVKALQEAMTRIETLESEVNALKGG